MATLLELEKKYVQELGAMYPVEEIRQLFCIVCEDVLGIQQTKIQLRSNTMEIQSETEQQGLEILVKLKTGQPLQHILGKADFYGMKLCVSEATLIPRSETEELVHLTIQQHKKAKELRIIDIGTGTGCIAIALAKHLPQAQVWAIDVSKEALEIAKKNAREQKQNIHFIQGDILEWDLFFQREQKFDIIISNPPYITPKEKAAMHSNVLNFEPELALFVEESAPLLFYDHISDFAKSHLYTDGQLYFEINQYLSSETASLLQKKGFQNVAIHQDINGADRIISARRP